VLADKPTDTFIHMRNWGKGFVYVNGKNLGRYWMTAGPQKTLYLPGPWLKKGYNKIVWFEEEIIGDNIEFLNTPELGERSAGDDIQVVLTSSN
jgi:beta-galactosidase